MSRRRNLVDYHVHSTHSYDTRFSLFEMCKKATDIGVAEIGFSEHKDFDPVHPSLEHFDYERYTMDINKARELFKGRLVIRKGIEVDYQNCFEDEIKEWLRGKKFDFIIGSVHFINHTIVNDLFKTNNDLRKIYATYFEEINGSIESGLFDVVGHLDVIRKYVDNTISGLKNLNYEENVRAILRKIKEKRIFLEINAKMFAMTDDRVYPMSTRRIFEEYIESGGRLISVGSDAHSPRKIGNGIREVLDFLASYGENQVRLLFERK
ncbi:MAG: histidinol-phosphatase HisJ family protein [Candidatus Bathyarchaeota archaeon]|nr:histidinol-phosphatase HisJ family protein [Candidatus Bathyarchaeota archaeon]